MARSGAYVRDLWFGVWVLWFRVLGLGSKGKGLGFRATVPQHHINILMAVIFGPAHSRSLRHAKSAETFANPVCRDAVGIGGIRGGEYFGGRACKNAGISETPSYAPNTDPSNDTEEGT